MNCSPGNAGVACRFIAMCIFLPTGAALAADPRGADGATVRAVVDPATGQVDVNEAGKPVLRYNYRTVQPPEGFPDRIHPNNRKYARARSNYIHPLYGPDGELLTEDWSVDHPHHRGVYWAWPEVDFGTQRGDLHALQRVFARPSGNLQLCNEAEYAEIEAENIWKWEDRVPIVRERAIIRAYRSSEHGRHVDLRFRFTALEDGVTLARRGTKAYGGLNIRLSPVSDHEIVFHTDPADAQPRMAWADSVGNRADGQGPAALAVLEKRTNPHWPGQWVQFPKLPWFQPTFPAAGTRYALKQGQPLVLQYRLWIRRGGKATEEVYREQWKAYNPP